MKIKASWLALSSIGNDLPWVRLKSQATYGCYALGCVVLRCAALCCVVLRRGCARHETARHYSEPVWRIPGYRWDNGKCINGSLLFCWDESSKSAANFP